jgi:hypothetical protein
MVRRPHPMCCDECAVEITWTPVIIGGRPYCCHDCAVGLECDCANSEREVEDATEPFWLGSVNGGADAAYDIEYGFELEI